MPHLPAPVRVAATQLCLAACVLLMACDRQQAEPVAANVQNEPPAPAEARRLPAPLPALSRADLIGAVRQTASDYAAGQRAKGADSLVDRAFAARIAFGCAGPAKLPQDSDMGGLATASRGPEGKTIELRMTPGDWTSSALVAESGAAPAWEAVEGFWIPMPWLMTGDCPAVEADPLQTGTPAVTPQTVGLAAVFEAGGSRIGRRNGRAYAFTIRAEGDAPAKPSPQGYRLALAGRLAAFPDGRAIRCHAAGPEQRPVCIVAAKLDRVAFEDAEGKTLAEWRPG